MPALPASSDFTGSTRTNAEMRLTHAALRAYLAGLLGEDGTTATALASLGVKPMKTVLIALTSSFLTAALRRNHGRAPVLGVLNREPHPLP